MLHGPCPVCRNDTLTLWFPTPPDHLTDEEWDEWQADQENLQPIGVACVTCGYAEKD